MRYDSLRGTSPSPAAHSARNPLAAIARACLIRQIWWGDRVLAALRDGEDCREASAQLDTNARAAQRAMLLLREAIRQDLDRR